VLFKSSKDVDHGVDVVDTNTHLKNTKHVNSFIFPRVVYSQLTSRVMLLNSFEGALF
jgi:hypothetical protein